MKSQHHKSRQWKDNRSAFTLVEMLVSVSLVLLMMTMFATIFQITTKSMSKQRGISENDQRARSVFTVMRKDFQHRTMRYSLPFYPNEDSAKSVTAFSNRAGYLYFSMNEPNSGLDDLIQFTVSSDVLFEDTDGTPYFGRAAELDDRTGALNGLARNPNQPETDDGSLTPNSIGSSPAAEVCYFLRNGNLYRRILLVRDPISYAGKNLAPQPTALSGFNYFMGQTDPSDNTTYDGLFKPSTGAATDDFYRLFDYSAFAENIGGLQRTVFVGSASLSNETAGAAAHILAHPQRRFGFNPVTGLSREHTVHPAAGFGPSLFLGRFLQAETSTVNFNWPQGPSTLERTDLNDSYISNGDGVLGSGNPLDIIGTPLALNESNAIVAAFDGVAPSVIDPATGNPAQGRGGSRRVEDLLLTNVHEMKVEVWDTRLQRFVFPGHLWRNPGTNETGDFHASRCLNVNYGPLGSTSPVSAKGHVFDTWHPFAGADSDASGPPFTANELNAPYRPYLYYPPRQSDSPPGPSSNGTLDSTRTYWQPGNNAYIPGNPRVLMDGSIVFAPVTFDGDMPNEIFEWPPGPGTDNVPPQAFDIAYVCIAANDLNSDGVFSSGGSINFPTSPGRITTDFELTWQSFDNRRPLESIRVQFRFYDKTSDTLRQMSLVIPMTDIAK